MTKLHLGCGTNKKEGWINIDSVQGCRPDVVHDLTLPLPYADMTVDEVLAEDLLEHFDKYMRVVVFSEWARVLKVGGVITVQVPNFKKILFKYFKFGFNNFVDFIFGENLWNSKIYIGHFGNHKWGYSPESLRDFIAQFGIQVEQIETKGLNIRVTARKTRHVSIVEIDRIVIASHANKFGPGPDRVDFGFVRGRIKEFQEPSYEKQ